MKLDRRLGFRFLPTDEELVVDYLVSKLIGFPLPSEDYVKDCNLYGDLEPWDIWKQFRSGHEEHEDADNGGGDDEKKNDLYFFTPLKKVTATGSNIDRNVGSKGGSWHGEDSGKVSQTPDGSISWVQKRFSYRTKKNNKGQKNNNNGPSPISWIMHEYCLLDRPINSLGLDSAAATRLAVCRIRKKDAASNKRKKNNKSHKVFVIDSSDDYMDFQAEPSITKEAGRSHASQGWSINKRRRLDDQVVESTLEAEILGGCLSEIKEGRGSGGGNGEAVSSLEVEVEGCCDGQGDEQEEDDDASVVFDAEIQQCLAEVEEDCGGDQEEADALLFDAEIEECLVGVEEDCGGGDGDKEEEEDVSDQVEGCMAEEEVETPSEFEALVQQYYCSKSKNLPPKVVPVGCCSY